MSVEDIGEYSPTEAVMPRVGAPVRRRWRVPGRRTVGGKVLVLQHRGDAPAGPLLDVVSAFGLEAVTVHGDRGEQLPDPGSLKLAVVLGCDGLVDDDGQGWVGEELDWLRSADRAGTAVLGVGFGAQALAVALGGGVERALRPQRGWVKISTSLPALIAPGPWLAWQEDVIELPARAQLLAHNRLGPQAFRVNGHLGVQFHPEVTPELVSDWVARSDEVLDVQGILEATSRDYKTALPSARRLLSGFIGSIDNRLAST